MECAVQDLPMVKTEHLLVQLLTLRQETNTPCVAAVHTVAGQDVAHKILHAVWILMQLGMG